MDLKTRLKKLEQTMAKQQTTKVWDEACICFPPDELPEFCWTAEAEVASAIVCPLHGVRFHAIKPRLFIYRAKWLRGPKDHTTVDYAVDLLTHSPQYSKAMRASFPAALWPAEVSFQFQPTRTMLILRDGSEIPSGGSVETWQPENLAGGQ
jgi:hypothetical protein